MLNKSQRFFVFCFFPCKSSHNNFASLCCLSYGNVKFCLTARLLMNNMIWDNLFSGLPWSICLHEYNVMTVTRRWDWLKGLLERCKVSSCYFWVASTFFIPLIDLTPLKKEKEKNSGNNMNTSWKWLGFKVSAFIDQRYCLEHAAQLKSRKKKTASNVQLCSEKYIKTNEFTENSNHKSSATIG